MPYPIYTPNYTRFRVDTKGTELVSKVMYLYTISVNLTFSTNHTKHKN